MARSRAPKPFAQRKASTLFLRVPSTDWPRVKIGEKTEFRTLPRDTAMPNVLRVRLPTPVVAYAANVRHEYDCALMVFEEHRYEPLFNINEDREAVAREGFESYDHFRRYWRARHQGQYWPMRKVHVWRVRPWCDDDYDDMAAVVLEWLYGDYLEPRELQGRGALAKSLSGLRGRG